MKPIHYPFLLACVTISMLVFHAELNARTFEDKQGRSIQAKIIKFENDQVTLQTGGRFYTLSISEFSKKDQDYIRKKHGDGVKPNNSGKSDPFASPKEDKSTPVNAPNPGQTFTFKFPDLGIDFHGKPAQFQLKIPRNYSPSKPVGLIIYLGGGKGNSRAGDGGLTKGEFVEAGLPYPDAGRSSRQNNMVGEFDEVWDYWEPMLKKIEETVPNLHPHLRIMAGFSNGAHAIDGVLGEERAFGNFFSAYVMIEGGGYLGGNYKAGDNAHAYVAFGENSPNANNLPELVDRVEGEDMHVVSNMMKNTGHQFPGSEKNKVKKWLYNKVIPDLKSRKNKK